MSRDEQIRRRVRELIKEIAPTAVVAHRWLEGPDAKQWIDLLRSRAENRIHAWCMLNTFDDASAPSGTWAPQRIGGELGYRIWGFLAYAGGSDGENSQDRFAEECQAVKRAILADRSLGLPELVSDVKSFNFDFEICDMGGQVVHVAKGELVVLVDADLENA
jgi:hypothetical protein